MKRYPIEVVKKKLRRRDPEEVAEISRRHYMGLLAFARKTWVWDEVEKKVEISCDTCGSFALNFLDLVLLVEDLIYYLSDPDLRSSFSGRLSDALETLNDDLSCGYEEDIEEVAIILDPKCACYSYLVGKPIEKKPEENHFDHRGSGVSVSKYIGPRLKW